MGFQWEELTHMHWLLITFLGAHVLYSIYGNYVPDKVPVFQGWMSC